MKLSLDWLSDWIDLDLAVEELAERLTMVGLSVDAIVRPHQELAAVVAGRVESVEKHPNAERLTLCRVFDGRDTLTVVCGAPNVKPGGIYPFARVGVVLPGGPEIRAATIRGERSLGMLCSAAELALSDDAAGLMELRPDLRPGIRMTEALGLGDTVLDLEVPHNRPDWLSVRGVAREISAVLAKPLKSVASEPPEIPEPGSRQVRIVVEDLSDCRLYGGRVVRNVRIAPSPDWLRRRLEAVGQRSINNVVDVTNYILHTYGQPIHAFDLARLRGGVIEVRRARPGEFMETLDGVKRILDAQMLVITDGEGPVAIAGIMGGAASEVTPTTTELLLESAHFTAPVVREGARRLGMETEASTRFGRGVDPPGVRLALDHTARLIQEISGGEVLAGQIVAGSEVHTPRSVALRPCWLETVLGQRIELEEAMKILDRLGFRPTRVASDEEAALSCTVPSWRLDVEREIDLVEEVARFHGYDRFTDRQLNASGVAAERHPVDRRIERSGGLLVGMGLSEIVTSSFISPEESEISQRWTWAAGEPVALLNAKSKDASVLRGSLWPLHLRAARRNLNRGAMSLRLFEHGKIFFQEDGRPASQLPSERWELSGVLCGERVETGWAVKQEPVDLFWLKGLLTAYARGMYRQEPVFEPYEGGPLLAGASFRFAHESGLRGLGGRIHPAAAKSWDVPDDLWLFSIDFEASLELNDVIHCYREVSRFPGVKRDLAFFVPASVTHREIEAVMLEAGGGLVESIRLFDLYEGPPVPPGQKSLAYTLVFQAPDRSLLSEEVDRLVETITAKILKACGAILRDS